MVGRHSECNPVLLSKQSFRGFLTALLIKSINKKNRNRRSKRATLSGNGNSKLTLRLPNLYYSNAVSVRYLAKYLKCSVDKAFRLKQAAAKYGFIKVFRKDREFELYANEKLISPCPQQLKFIYEDMPSMFGRIYLRDGIPFYRQPDQIVTTI